MSKAKLVYILSLRNAAADRAGQNVDYKGEPRYMKSPLEYLAQALDTTPLGDLYSLEGVIYDDDAQSPRDQAALADYGFAWHPERKWIFPAELRAQGRLVRDMLHPVPSAYRRLPLGAPARAPGKSAFERALLDKLLTLQADLVLLDGLLVILDELVRPGARFERRMVNIHPGITRTESPYERRGACATLDALYGVQGKKVVDWSTMEKADVPVVRKTGASLHYVDNGIDSGEVIFDALKTDIAPDDTILELRWNNFNRSLFPALHQGLTLLAPHVRRGAAN
ncbi:formyltransferase family protein [Variovorax ginsengisoli]|uniref:phosphoribosylglycinamide formyltransferase 1 n=1 Tax=Variovorax ginsengisoli TaxID=363844 RepID=A0ABT9S927_9BURK|nr:formyltransferase family protein [Variovorax ginsengisoli]MDP9900695.1 folate-dependent phosphoribosylglycinamide formyltransferase PurN [Variovorax ginsengisoli]